MAASPSAYLFYGVLLDEDSAADLAEDDSYVAIEEALEEIGVELLHYGETPRVGIALAIDRSVLGAHAGSAAPVKDLKVGKDWDTRLARAREIVELEGARAPRWYITSRVSW
jgi:hypothetical protein